MLVSYSLLTDQLTLNKFKLLYKTRKRLPKISVRPILMSKTLKDATSEISINRTESSDFLKSIDFLKLLSFSQPLFYQNTNILLTPISCFKFLEKHLGRLL